MKLITRNNFLNWYSNEVQAADISDIPNGYIKDNNRCNYAPLLVAGEAMRFYINTLDGLDDIISLSQTSNVSIVSQGNLSANQWAFVLGGTPLTGTEVDFHLKIDGDNAKTASLSPQAQAGDTLVDLCNTIVDVINSISGIISATAEVYNTTGVKITAATSVEADSLAVINVTVGSSPKLKLINAKTGLLAKDDVSPLQTDEFDSTFTYYSEVVIDGSVLPGDYYFTIATDSVTFLTSSLIKVVSSGSEYRNYTARCTFSHDRYFYGVNYQNITSFTQQFRLHINKIDLQEETDVSVYNEVTTGKQRTFNAYMKLPIKLETYYFDEEAHRAAIVMFGHSSIFINGKEYVKKSPYKVNTDPTQKTNKGEIEMYDVEFATVNRCTLPPEDVNICTGVTLPSVSFPDAIVGTPYHVTFTVSGTAPITDTVLNALPTWMTFTFVDGVADFSGTPDEEGTVHIDINFLNCANAPVNIDKTFTVADNRARFLTPTFVEEDTLTAEETANLKGKPGATLTITLNPLTNNNGGTLKVNSVIVAENDTFTVTLDSNGEGTFTARIDGLANSPSVIRGYFTITATTDGTIGSPDYYQISKVF